MKQPFSSRVLWDMVDGPMPRGLLGVGSGDVVVTREARSLYLGGYSSSFRNRLYVADGSIDGSLAEASWRVRTDRRGRAAALAPDPPRSAWDGGGMHTPSYLPATDTHPERIYYAGRSGRRHVGAGSSYAIGVLERLDGRWRRTSDPLLRGAGGRPSLLEPRVVRDAGRHVMWFLAAPHEVAPGEQPDYELRCATSADGVTDWSEPRVFATSTEGFFDVALTRTGERWSLILARGRNLHGTRPYPPQGLWAMSAPRLSPDRADWSEPKRILDTDAPDVPAWMGAGVCDPAAHVDAAGRLTVFVTGTRRRRSWLELAQTRLRRGRRPPPPAPFFLATGVLSFDAFTALVE